MGHVLTIDLHHHAGIDRFLDEEPFGEPPPEVVTVDVLEVLVACFLSYGLTVRIMTARTPRLDRPFED